MKRRPWPNTALAARDVALMEASRGLRALRPLIDTRFTSEEQLRRVAIAIDALREIQGAMNDAPSTQEADQ